MDEAALVSSFNDCIMRRDLDGLADLMAEEHVFVDTANNIVAGKDNCLRAWRGFFAAFPDYQNIFEHVVINGATVAVAGRSVCSDEQLAGSALWSARTENGRIAEWRVYGDTPKNRTILGL